MLRGLLRRFFALKRQVRHAARPPAAPPLDPRAAQDPWLKGLLAHLGERYHLGEDSNDGTQILRRTARARFNPMQVWLRPRERVVLGDYQVRAHGERAVEEAKALLDARVTGPLRELGLVPAGETVEEWAGQVITRRYQGRCEEAENAAAAVRFMCQESEQILDTAAEG